MILCSKHIFGMSTLTEWTGLIRNLSTEVTFRDPWCKDVSEQMKNKMSRSKNSMADDTLLEHNSATQNKVAEQPA